MFTFKTLSYQCTKNLDQEIIDQLRKGDDGLFRKFYLHEQERFLAWCHKELDLNAEEAQDFYQESQMYLYENIVLGKLDQLTSQLSTYLYSIAKNQIRMKHRKLSTVLKHEDRLCEHLIFLKGEEESNEEKVLAARRVTEEIGRMLEPCKTLLRLFYYENLSFKDIAARMGYKNDTVAKNQKKRCLERLRKSTQQ